MLETKKMDSINLGRMQCIRFLIKAAQEMHYDITGFETNMDSDTQKSLRINLLRAFACINAALTDIEQAIKDAGKN